MSSKEQDFKERFVAMMRDLQESGSKDPEAVWLIGSLAARLIDLYKLKTWREFKVQLSREAYDRLLADFREQGNSYHQEGKPKAAYAIQLLAMSTIAPKQTDPQVLQGDRLLDDMINRMVAAYRQALAAETARVH
ncbi:MAG: hypothetical protein ACTHLT_00345 [Devosia sp.]